MFFKAWFSLRFMAFLQVEDSDVNGIPAVKLLSDNRRLQHCQELNTRILDTLFPFVKSPQEKQSCYYYCCYHYYYKDSLIQLKLHIERFWISATLSMVVCL